MKLTRQLALVSLGTLILPWAALQSLQIFDDLLREGQTAALQATARAIAARLGADDALLNNTGLGDAPAVHANQELYLHTLPAPPVVDGDAADWSTFKLAPLTLSSAAGPAVSLRLGRHNQSLYALVDVADPNRQFHRESSPQLASGDHLVLYGGEPRPRYYVLRAPLPGPIAAYYRDDAGLPQQDYRIRGHWRETDQGYRVELRLPASWATGALGIAAVDKQADQITQTGTLGDLATLVGGLDPGVLPAANGQVVAPSKPLQQALQAFATDKLRVTVLDRHQWQRAQAGQIDTNAAGQTTPWLLRWLDPRPTLPPWQDYPSGRWAEPGDDLGSAQWYRAGNADIARVRVPLYRNWPDAGALESQRTGTVVVEQRISPWRMIDNRAGVRLLTYTLGAGAVLLALLIGYAVWLSLRIRRLSQAAQRATRDREALNLSLERWPRYRLLDEVSELSEHYRALLTQVRAHTDYLKTLTSKLAHELRTPLAVVNSSLDNLTHGGDPAPYIDRARQGTQRLSRLVSAMTEASRVEASISNAETEDIDITQLVTDMCAAYNDAYPDHSFICEIAPAPTGSYRNAVAPELLVQLLDKLVDNAASFSPPEAPIALHLSRQGVDEPYLALSVSNQGPPLPAELEGQLFNSLTSKRTQASGDQLHLGLGLFIVDLIARFHQGSVRAENQAGGVIFTLSLPVNAPALSAHRTESVQGG
ncbi:ATP-binding protein [Gilvimarinus xylanilyticus]|uniref:histidine kinase n=1 Tax=Gilvimarinus xylanilyticus TaxID=2944139 RepID=A0A9X2KVD4_9GAMM|nr:ATP-binding protein [Gilvimarinus xylanilyticus]